MIVTDQNTGEASGDTFVSVENLVGSSWNDTLIGTYQDNLIAGRANDDLIIGRGGDDLVLGEAGNDHLYGSNGNDSVFGGEGADILWGGIGADHLDGGDGVDRVQYHQATTGLKVDLAYSNLNTGEAAGDAFINIEDVGGSNCSDEIWGDDGANRLWGFSGQDALFGRNGNDQLIGGGGNDQLTGGLGADIFWFKNGFEEDIITDFSLLEGDRIALREVTEITNFQDLIANHVTTVNGNAVFSDGAGTTITLNGVNHNSLTEDDFTF